MAVRKAMATLGITGAEHDRLHPIVPRLIAQFAEAGRNVDGVAAAKGPDGRRVLSFRTKLFDPATAVCEVDAAALLAAAGDDEAVALCRPRPGDVV